MIKVDDIQPHFPTDTVTLVSDPDRIAALKAALAAKPDSLDLDAKFDYQFFNSQPEIGPSTFQCIFRAKKGGADFISDPSLWALGDYYVIHNELAAIA